MNLRRRTRQLIVLAAVGAVIVTGTGLAVARPWSAGEQHHRPAPLGIGKDPDAPAGHEVDADEFLSGRAELERARIGDAFAGGHGNLRTAAIRTQQRYQARHSAAGAPRFASTFNADSLWEPIGPNGIPNGQTSPSVAVSGRATAIAIDPTDANIVYIGAANGGVFRTTDGGTHWTPIFDQAQTQAIGSLALAPSDPTTLYVGTGEPNNSGDSYAGVGLYRIDHARTTADLVGPINPTVRYDGKDVPAFLGAAISRILVSPTDPGTVVLASTFGIRGVGGTQLPHRSAEGLFRSTNADGPADSVSFTALQWPRNGPAGEAGVDVAMTGTSLATLLVSVEDLTTQGDDGIWRVINALGTPTWTKVLAMPQGNDSHLAVGAGVAYAYGQGNSNGDLRISTDGGITWTNAPAAFSQNVCGGQCWYDSPVAVDPANPQHVLLGGAADSYPAHILVESTDGGITGDGGSHTAGLHADNHAIVFAPQSPPGQSVVWDATDGGVYKSLDGGLSWTTQNTPGLNTLQFQSLAVDPQDPNLTIGGTQDNGTEEHFGSQPTDWKRIDYGDGGFALIDSHSTDASRTMYHTYFNQTNNLIGFVRWRSTEPYPLSEGNWTGLGCGEGRYNGISCSDKTLFYAPMALGPGATTDTVYFGSDRLYRSEDQGTSMSVVGSAGPVDGARISAIGISSTDDGERLIGLDDGTVWLASGGGSFAQVSGAWPKTQTDGEGVYVAATKIDPTDPNRAYVVLGDFLDAADQHVWTTSNLLSGTPTWTAGTGVPDVPVNDVVIDPRAPQDVFVGTDIGVYGSADHGKTWHPFGSGLPVTPVFQLAVASPGTAGEALRIATHGRGMWQLPLPVLHQLESVTVTPTSATVPQGSLQQYDAVAHFTDGSDTDVSGSAAWSSSSNAVATVDGTGLAKGVHQGGPVTLTATYGGMSATAQLTVGPKELTTITVLPGSTQIANGTQTTLTATGTYTDASTADLTATATWTSSAPTTATVSQGVVTGHAVGGPVTISARVGSVTGTAKVTVVEAALTSLTVTPARATRTVGQKQKYVATGHFTDGSSRDMTGKVQWSSSVPKVATIVPSGTGAGTVTPRAPGKTTVTARLDTIVGSATLTAKHARPVVTSFSPKRAKAHAKLTVKGKYFYPGHSLVVRIGKKKASHVKVVSSHKLTCTLPAHVKTGVVSVTTDGGTGKSHTKFHVRH